MVFCCKLRINFVNCVDLMAMIAIYLFGVIRAVPVKVEHVSVQSISDEGQLLYDVEIYIKQSRKNVKGGINGAGGCCQGRN